MTERCPGCGCDKHPADAQCQACVLECLVEENTLLKAQVQRDQETIASLEKRLRWYRAAHLLCSNEFAFLGHRDGEDARLMYLEQDEAYNPLLMILCSDTFAWACADAERAEYEDAERLLAIARTDGWVGLMRWVQERRQLLGEQCEPIPPVARMFATHDALHAQLDAARKCIEAADECLRVLEAPRGKSYECLDAYDAARAEFAKVEGIRS